MCRVRIWRGSAIKPGNRPRPSNRDGGSSKYQPQPVANAVCGLLPDDPGKLSPAAYRLTSPQSVDGVGQTFESVYRFIIAGLSKQCLQQRTSVFFAHSPV